MYTTHFKHLLALVDTDDDDDDGATRHTHCTVEYLRSSTCCLPYTMHYTLHTYVHAHVRTFIYTDRYKPIHTLIAKDRDPHLESLGNLTLIRLDKLTIWGSLIRDPYLSL